MEKNEEIKQEEKIYVGIIMREDGWYRFYSDGNKHYTFEKCEENE